MLASYVVFQNHLPMMADYPTAYRKHPLTKVMVEIPETWDDTRAVAAKVGEYVAIARRDGDEWWIGAMTDRKRAHAGNSPGVSRPGQLSRRSVPG